nr:MAG TPA: hypothetical protein [Caudoviricetes sp.]
MVKSYEVRGSELGGDEFYSDWVKVVKYEDYLILEAQLRQRTEERNAFAKAIADAGDEMVDEATYADAVALTERLGL